MAERSKAWVRMYCSTDRQARVATFRRAGREWQLTTVGGPAPSTSSAAGKLPVAGSFGISPEYPGCPGCRSDSYARCGNCNQIGCWRSSESYFRCGNCGDGGQVSGSIESLGAMDAG
jgi:hypothetical protein